MYLTDLFFPPLVTLLLGLLVAASLHLGARFDAPSPPMLRWLFPVHCGMAVVLACYALGPFFALQLPFRYLASLAALPYYAVWKLLFITGRNPTSWVRTPREPATCDGTG